MDTTLRGKISDLSRIASQHPLADFELLNEVEIPFQYKFPFGLSFMDGEFHLFWASSAEEADRWTSVFKQLIPQPMETADFANYVAVNKNNTFLTTLYLSLKRKKPPRAPKVVSGFLKVIVQDSGSNSASFKSYFYLVDEAA